MARTPEGKVKDAVVKRLKANSVYYFFPATFGMGRSGVPDIICCVDGRFLAIECKSGDKVPTLLQEREIRAIAAAGGHTLIVNEANVEEVTELLRWMRGQGNDHRS